MVWKCSVSCGSKPIDPLVKCHQHFICEKCGQVYDVLVDRENEIKPARLPHRGFKVTSHQTPSTAHANIARGRQMLFTLVEGS